MTKHNAGIAIVINLDYLQVPITQCRMMWVMIETAMQRAGFILYGRVFVAQDDPAAADRARRVMRGMEPTFAAMGFSLFDVVREFYCYDLATRIDLNMVQAAAEMQVEESEPAVSAFSEPEIKQF